MDDLPLTQERMAHLERLCDDLSDIVAKQADQITRLERQVLALIDRERDRAEAGGGGVIIGDERPPHY
ncbi:MAG: SlyX family protein [Marinovum sp.]|nr:SlyX family protein [Marinovum sp.]